MREPTFDATQRRVRRIVTELKAFDARLGELVAGRPDLEDDAAFDPVDELLTALDCVRTDLLADAVATLAHVADADEHQLHADFEHRRQLLAVAG